MSRERGERGERRGPDPDSFNARARAKDGFILEIARLLAEGRWTGAERAAMAERAGVELSSLDGWVGAATRMLRCSADVESYRALNLARLNATFERAEKAGEAVAAVAEQNRMLGLHAVTKVSVTAETYAALTPVAMLASIRQQIRELTDAERQLAREVEGDVVVSVMALPAGGNHDDEG